jgi:hypothetical protein
LEARRRVHMKKQPARPWVVRELSPTEISVFIDGCYPLEGPPPVELVELFPDPKKRAKVEAEYRRLAEECGGSKARGAST